MGKNLVATLERLENIQLMKFGKENTIDELRDYVSKADFVFHLAGINRPQNIDEFESGNVSFTNTLLDLLSNNDRKIPIVLTSSTQADNDNPYGNSKRSAEEFVISYGKKTGANVYVYRLPNVFGKWCKPNYNSVIATWCHNIAHELPITVNDPSVMLNLVYIDDVVEEFIHVFRNQDNKRDIFCEVPVVHAITLGEIADLIHSFKDSRGNRSVPNMSDEFTKKLYSTYLSYLPEDQFSYQLKMNIDNRGSFTEFIRTPDRGQVSVNISKPGIIKGNHWHHTKNEKFLVVTGRGVIRLRKMDSEKVIEYFVSGEKLEAVDIPTGYTHNIENLGESDMVTIMWANEPYNPDKPDTYFLGV